MAASLGVDVRTVERDLQAIRDEGLDELPTITSETWGAALMDQYRERVAELREQLDMVEPADHLSTLRILQLLRHEDSQVTKMWQSLGLLHEVPPHELAIVRVMRTLQQLPPEQLEEIYNHIGSEEEFTKLFRARVQEPLQLVRGEDYEEQPVEEGN